MALEGARIKGDSMIGNDKFHINVVEFILRNLSSYLIISKIGRRRDNIKRRDISLHPVICPLQITSTWAAEW